MVDDSAFELLDVMPRSWADAFPWLPGQAIAQDWDEGPWWEWPIDGNDAVSRESVIGNIVQLAIERLGKRTIGDIFPGLPSQLNLVELELPGRARNLLLREQILTGADIADLSVVGLLGYRNAGIGTVTSILRQLVAASSAQAQAAVQEAPVADEVEPLHVPAAWLSEVSQDCKILAGWHHILGNPDRELLSELPLGAPESVIAAQRRLLRLSASDVLPSSPESVADQFDRVIQGLDGRYQRMLVGRVFAWQPKTLEEMGQEFGVTRERARQLEVKARAKLSNFVAGDNLVADVAMLLQKQFRGVRPLAEILAEMPALSREVPAVGQPAWRVFDVLDESYEIADGWCAQPSLEEVRRDTGVSLDESSDPFGVVRVADVTLFGAEAGAIPWLEDWLRYLGYELRDEFVLLKTASLNDMAAAVLSIEGSPLTLEELHRKIGRGALESLRNQVGTDSAFTKVDREHFALTEWGMEGYTSIRGEIGKLLEQAGGELPLATVVEILVGRFAVSPNSVTVYAGSPPFQVMNGIVRNQTRKMAGAGKNPAKVQGYYRRGEDWLYRTTVTFDHLRGSGWPASTALSTILNMAPGQYVELPSRLGNQKFSYKGHQPAYGSIKRFLEDLDLGIGDEIFLVFRGDGTFDVEQLPLEPIDKLSQVLRLVGARMSLDPSDAIAALASAIKFAPGADLASIAEGYKARKEENITDVILSTDAMLSTKSH
jgi:hypothetical protein